LHCIRFVEKNQHRKREVKKKRKGQLRLFLRETRRENGGNAYVFARDKTAKMCSAVKGEGTGGVRDIAGYQIGREGDSRIKKRTQGAFYCAGA
jgi:hypothetical protein